MKNVPLTWAVIAFLLGNFTGAITTVAAFGADVRELKVRVAAIERTVYAGGNTPSTVTQSGEVRP